ncbi:short-chain dehydrogenase reductase SDR [Fusarium pseudoanthophilum]|uniref:Short-chain dehydrogenase reductase SDR n=1 Tax=Fusarium pseudoanthophilum TaxID=48495 RepID=A0A8H5KYI2_9HYPO|nr:short-chain dehydrogenase reductase SDR [Fusarium pseudoanthophilum]
MQKLTPHVVIVPASFAPPSLYSKLVRSLSQYALETTVIDLPSVGFRDTVSAASMEEDAGHIRKVTTKLADDGHEIILVMHSYGGICGTESTAGVSRTERQVSGKPGGIVRLVYISSPVPEIGGSVKTMMGDNMPHFMKLEGDYLVAESKGCASVNFSDLPTSEALTTRDLRSLSTLAGKTVIVTGGANGIGAETVKLFNSHGANTVVADLERTRAEAESVIRSLQHPSAALFFSVNILVWDEMRALFSQCIQNFGKIDIVVANAGIMESQSLFDITVDGQGELRESIEGFRVIDVNLKGTINRHVVLVTSTSGYIGTTGVGAYVTSKHGLTGLLRASQQVARGLGININAVAPFFTPTPTFKELAEKWKDSGLKSNTPADVAETIALASSQNETGKCFMVVGGKTVEVEDSRSALIEQWLGRETAGLLQSATKLFDESGYPLPDGQKKP